VVLYAPAHVRLNEEDDDAYFLHGRGQSDTLGIFVNGRFASLVGGDSSNFTSWTETKGTAATIAQETTVVPTGEYYSAKVTNGTAGPTRLSNDFYATKEEAYQFTYQCKSDGTASATVRFNDTTSLSDSVDGNGEYSTWGTAGGAYIAALACTTADTEWTTKSIRVRVDASNRGPTLQILAAGANGSSVYIGKVAWRPLWTDRNNGVWSTPAGVLSGSLSETMLLKGTVFTDQAADQNSLSSSAIWYRRNYATNYAAIYVYSPEGIPSSESYNGGNIYAIGGSTSATIDVNSKTFITLDGLDVRASGHQLVKGVTNDFIMDGVTAQLMAHVTNVTARLRMIVRNSTLTYGDWLLDLSGCSYCQAVDNTVSHAIPMAALDNEGGLIGFASNDVATDSNVVRGNTLSYALYGIASHGATARPSVGFYASLNDVSHVPIGLWEQSESTGMTTAVYFGNKIHDLDPATANIGTCVTAGQSVGYLGYRTANTAIVSNNYFSGVTHGLMLGLAANAQKIVNNVVSATTKNMTMCSMTNAAFAANIVNYNDYVTTGAAMFEYSDGGDATQSTTFTGFQAQGKEANGLQTDPLFMSTTDYRLRPTSLLRRAGTGGVLCIDYRGRACYPDRPDIGAYQSSSGDPAATRAARN